MDDGTEKSTSTSGSAEQHNGNNGYTRPPVFDGENFEYWKDKLESYFLGLEGDLWDLLMDGYKHPVNASGVKLTRCHTLIFDPPEMTYLQDFHQVKISTQGSHSSIWYLIEDAQRQESSGKGSINTRISL